MAGRDKIYNSDENLLLNFTVKFKTKAERLFGPMTNWVWFRDWATAGFSILSN